MQERRELTDDDWAALREAVPSFGERWAEIVAESHYEPDLPYVTLHDFAEFIVVTALRDHADEVEDLADTLEALYTRAAITDDESLADLLTIGLLEGLIEAADEHGIPLTRLKPLLHGNRTREHWDRAFTYQKPDFVWSDEKGAIPSGPLPRPVGTVEVHRGRRNAATGNYRLDVRLVSGEIRAGFLLRFPISRDSWFDREIASVERRSPDVPDEYEIEVVDEPLEGLEPWDLYLQAWDNPFWQIAAPPEQG
ncbi:MAG: hypothetical protein ABR499_08990 [Gemmatimonadaceae bacterium]